MVEDNIADRVTEYEYPISNSEATKLINEKKSGDFEGFIEFVFGKPSDIRKTMSYIGGTTVFLGDLVYNLYEKAMQIAYVSRDGLDGFIDKVGEVIKKPEMIIPVIVYSTFVGIISGLAIYGGINGVEAGIRGGKRLNEKIKDNLGEKAVNYFNNHKLVITK